MELVNIAKIAVSAAPYVIDKPYDYMIPEGMDMQIGERVTVPFGRGNRSTEGMVLALGTAEKTPALKLIATQLDATPVLNRQEIELALWLRSRYFCTMYEAVKTILPAGLWYRFRESYRLSPDFDHERAEQLAGKNAAMAAAVAYLEQNGETELETLKTACGDRVSSALALLCKKGLVFSETAALRKISDKTRRIVTLAVSAEEAMSFAEAKRKSAPLRYEVLKLLSAEGFASAADLCYFTGASAQTLRSLEKSGIVTFSEEEQLRIDPPERVQPGAPIVLNDEQQTAFSGILSLLESGKPEVALLQGVTGSGKTLIYIRLVQETLARGKTAIILVPEIVLTPQMMRKFSSYFGGDVAMLHSSLRLSERYDQWKRIARGEVQVVLGTRSAIFAPLQNLGLIVLDEEQENSYQSENPPRYHTRDVAKYLCAQRNCTLLLGSATPSIESAHSAKNGKYHPFVLSNRYNEKSLPHVFLADLREEVRAGNDGSVSGVLRREIAQNLARGEQSILFLNRRGNSRMLVCGECGMVPECPRCSVALTYHSANERLMCHYCGHSEKAYSRCPDCGGRMKYVGTGTQKVEEELHALFPGVEILRMDSDTAAGVHGKLLSRFEKEKIPILLGTQMVTKGLDFPNVTLVGVLAADLSLYVDNYHAAERTFGLLTQVVGRAGRGEQLGRAVIQTYTPDNDVIVAAAKQDFDAFYESELRLRRLRRYPPFADLFTLTVSGSEESSVLRACAALRDELRRAMNADGALRKTEPEILGPAPAPILRLKGRYRYRVLLVGKNDKATRDLIAYFLKEFARCRNSRGMNLFASCNALE